MKYTIKNLAWMSFILAVALLLPSCSDEDDAVMLPAVNVVSQDGEIMSLDYQRVIAEKEVVGKFVVKLDHPAQSPVLCTVGVDDSYVDAYNAAHHTSYKPMPASVYSLLGKDAIIKTGDTDSDSLRISFTSLYGLESGEEYLLPIVASIDETVAGKYTTGAAAYFKLNIDGELDYIAGLDMTTYNADMYRTLTFPGDEVVTIDGNTHTFEMLIYAYGWTYGTSYMGTWVGNDLNNNNEFFRGCELRSSSYYSNIGNRQCDLTSYSNRVTIPSGKWVRLTVTCDGTQTEQNKEIAYRLYLNGEEVASAAPSKRYGPSSSQRFHVGYTLTGIQLGGTSSSYLFNGIISEIRMWKKCLTADEVKANLREVASPSSADLYGYWKADEGTGNVLKDYSGNGRDLTFPESVTVKWKAELNDLPKQ